MFYMEGFIQSEFMLQFIYDIEQFVWEIVVCVGCRLDDIICVVFECEVQVFGVFGDLFVRYCMIVEQMIVIGEKVFVLLLFDILFLKEIFDDLY